MKIIIKKIISKKKYINNNMNNEKEKENLLNNFNILINKEDIPYEKEVIKKMRTKLKWIENDNFVKRIKYIVI